MIFFHSTPVSTSNPNEPATEPIPSGHNELGHDSVTFTSGAVRTTRPQGRQGLRHTSAAPAVDVVVVGVALARRDDGVDADDGPGAGVRRGRASNVGHRSLGGPEVQRSDEDGVDT